MSNVINGKVPDTGLLKGSVHAIIGRDGYSAYELALKHGFVGTEEEWLLSLNGVDGTVEFDKLTPAQKESLKGEAGVSGVYVGSGDMPVGYNVQIDPNGDSFSADDLARISNPNLIDNWYFADPINQRGFSTGIGTAYTIDRWNSSRYRTGDKSITLNSGYITIRCNDSADSAYIELAQSIESNISTALVGRQVTMSILTTGGLYSGTFVLTSGAYKTFAAGENVTVYVRSTTNNIGSVMIRAFYGGEINIIAAKLELGDKQTLAHQDANGNWVLNDIPNYGDMLLKCQRYYQLFSSAEKRPTDKRDFRPELRTNATAANTGTIEIEGVTYYYADANL